MEGVIVNVETKRDDDFAEFTYIEEKLVERKPVRGGFPPVYFDCMPARRRFREIRSAS